jgi:protein tyrosine/serine phosphatase
VKRISVSVLLSVFAISLLPKISFAVSFDDPPVFESIFARALPNYLVIHPGLSRSGRPDQDGLNFLRQRGFRTIVNIENDRKAVEAEAAAAQRLGLKFISIPMSWQHKPSDAQVNELLRLMKDPSLQPLIIHCKHGRDRTGLMVGLYRVFMDHWAPEKAYEEMLATGFRTNLKALDQAFRERTGMR